VLNQSLLEIAFLSAIAVLSLILFVNFIYAKIKATQTVRSYTLVSYARSFLPILVVIFIIRTFIAHPVYVPTGSLEPTVMPGDFVLINAYVYGLRLPFLHETLVKISSPKHGDIIQFISPPKGPHPGKEDLIKRVVGIPGDHLSYINKILYINGKKKPQKYIGSTTANDGSGRTLQVNIYQENLDGVIHDIYRDPDMAAVNFNNIVVPKGEYFMMGDNRDDSDDSRYWGFMPSSDIIGKASYVIINRHIVNDKYQFKRIGLKL